MKGGRTSLWASPFFGLTDDYIVAIYQQIDSLVEKGYSFYDLYTMPVPRRNFIVRLSIKKSEDEKRAMEKSRGVTEGTPVSKKELGKVPGFVASQASVKG